MNDIGLMKDFDIYESLPLSEQTLKKHKWEWQGYKLLNDLGHPSEYRILNPLNREIGMVKYYKGRKLAFYELEEPLGNNAEPIRNISEDDWRKDDR